MIGNRQVLRSDNLKVREQCLIDGRTHIFDYDLGRFLTQEELINGIVYNYDSLRNEVTESGGKPF